MGIYRSIWGGLIRSVERECEGNFENDIFKFNQEGKVAR